MSPVHPRTLAYARELRGRLTDSEELLWLLLRNRRLGGVKFRRQHPVSPYILDFYCEELALGVELDGGQHLEEKQLQKDQKRENFFWDRGIKIIRFWDNDVLCRTESVLEEIWRVVEARKGGQSAGAASEKI